MIVSTFPRRVREIEHQWIPMSDGTRLAARIWLPDDAERSPVPALLEYLPYRKRDGTAERDSKAHPYLAGHGYAAVRVDIRGSGESEGLLTDEYALQEQDDALEVIAWLAAQKWCSGAVGMFGISWGGFNALQVAARQPPALKAIVTLCSTDDRYRDDVHYLGGAKLNAGFGWAGFLFADMCRPPDPLLVGESWRDMWLRRLENLPLFLELWLRHQRRDDYWRHGSVCEDFAAIKCPVYAVGGWTDGYPNPIPRLLEHLSVPRKGLIGPWAHAYPHFALPGPQIGFLQEMLRWWDHWLKGAPTGIMDEPMLRAWMMEAVPKTGIETIPGRWVAEPQWPPPGVAQQRLFLDDHGLLGQRGSLRPRAVCSPFALGRHAGSWCPFSPAALADDQREDDADSLVFETPPLDDNVEILGFPAVDLELASDKPVALIAARLCDVHPDGQSLRVSFGVLNLTHRDRHDSPAPLVPGERYRVHLELKVAGTRFARGHRIRLALSTSYWPMVWPAPEAATVTVFDGSLELPVRRPAAADEALPAFPEPEMAPPDRPTPVRPDVVRFDKIGLEVASSAQYRNKMDGEDPLSPSIEMQRSESLTRGDWRVRIESQLQMSCTSETFRLRASIRAFEGDTAVVERDWDRTIGRDLV